MEVPRSFWYVHEAVEYHFLSGQVVNPYTYDWEPGSSVVDASEYSRR